ncbi:MAG: SpoVA/SpoVAEb family sporulation membrane protein [Clostridia bacterium]|nr:SpoVA/SpoVAEb family sporulation membrane protein [Clostridia bacterium]
MKKRNERYGEYVKAITPTTSPAHSLFNSFWIGGLTCVIAQLVAEIYALILPNYPLETISNFTSMTIIAVAILFTGLGFYDKIARRGGAGSFLPITGFANAISSASMEFKSEGLIFGTSVKMFSVVGPVVVNGVFWSTVAGLIRLIVFMVFGV